MLIHSKKLNGCLPGLTAIGPIFLHPAAYEFLDPYRNAGIVLPSAEKVEKGNGDYARSIIIAPPAVEDSVGENFSKEKLASGWMP